MKEEFMKPTQLSYTLMRSSLIILLLLVFNLGFSQDCYWQQEVSYKIDVDFDAENHEFDGDQTMGLTNHSPDTLEKIYIHLYFNAFQPGSMMDERSRAIRDPDKRVGDRISKLSKEEQGFHDIQVLKQENKDLKFKVEGTVLSADLEEPILPGETHKFTMKYHSQVPLQIRRSGRDNEEGIDFSMTQWYPKIAEYDEQGWHPTPYVAREFYGVWGNYKVNITIDREYILGATGVLQNPKRIGYGYGGTDFEPASNKDRLTWKFEAERVHDFAWGADPDYSHIVKEADCGVTMHFLYQKNDKTAENWNKLPNAMNEVFTYLNENNGEYPYEVYSFIQGGDGGMEYPMATLITGERPFNSLVGVSVHEVLHSWYQGVLATNESLYPWMDEGFTSYFSSYTMNHLKKLEILQGEASDKPYKGNVESYARFTSSGLEEPMSTHADFFKTNTAYSVSSYVKGGVFLHGLRYMIGEEDFKKGMLDYFNKWKFKHPDPWNFINVMEEQSDMELSWYLQNMMNTLHTIDYGVDTLMASGDNSSSLRLRKYNELPMPIDFIVDLKNGESHFYSIPLQIMRGHKPLPSSQEYTSAKLLPDWIWTAPDYQVQLPFDESQIKQIVIDPRMMLPDTDRKNNYLVTPESMKKEEEE